MQLKDGLLIESRAINSQMLAFAADQAAPSDGLTVTRWTRSPPPVKTWTDRAETAADRLVAEADFRSHLAEAFEAAYATPTEVVDAYAVQDGDFVQVNVLLTLDKRPWAWRFNEAGDVQAGFVHRLFPAEAREVVYLVRPFNNLDVPHPLVEWLQSNALPRIWMQLGPPNVSSQAPLPGLPGLRLFDTVETLLKACPDARADEPDMRLSVYTSNTCGADLLGRGIPIRFGFHEGSLRLVWQGLTVLPEADRAEMTRRIERLGRSICSLAATSRGPADGAWRCGVQRGEFVVVVGKGADLEIRAMVMPPMGQPPGGE